MGMNMVTIACDRISRYIEKEFSDVKFISLSSNLCTDKKPTALNMILGRGKSVIAECWIEEDIVKEKLKTDIDTFVEVTKVKNLIGSALAGSYGFNAHFANIIAAIYIATGQDEAHVVEGSLGFTLAEKENNKLYINITLPCVQVASVGGGTSLPVQYEMLSLLGCAGAGEKWGSNANKFAEIVAASVLAGEISLIGAQAAHHLARAHEKFGRKKQV
jgi:hydroxymethylglutaryl-CoA reductase (NADPH)